MKHFKIARKRYYQQMSVNMLQYVIEAL